jgi:cbb3-type cytochrome oxidase maturation protein
MFVVIGLIVISLTLGTTFLWCFVWAVRSGQYEDTLTPSMRMLTDEETARTKPTSISNQPNNLKST